jgi:hypothetical protein
MARRKKEESNRRKIFNLASGRSKAITLPVEVLREWGWTTDDTVELKVNNKKRSITITVPSGF